MRASARARRSAASATPGPSGNTSHSSAPQADLVRRGAGRHLVADQRAGRPRSGWAGRRPGRPARDASVADAARPAGRRQRARRLQRGVQRRLQQRAGGDQFLDPPPQAAGARPAALGAEQPAAHLGGLQAGQLGGERAVGRVEHVVAFVEHVAAWARRCRPARPRRPGSSPGHGWRRRAVRCARGGSCARRSSAASAGRRRGCTRRAGRRGRGWWRCRTARPASRAGRRPGCRHRRSPAPSGRSGRAG